MNLILNSQSSLSSALGKIRELWTEHKFIRLSIKVGTDRSLDANAISHVWYGQLALELPQDDAAGWKRYCKLHHGVGILRAEDEEFRLFYDSGLKHLSYERKLAAMDFVPVTSRMTTAQMGRYLDAVQTDFAARGVILESLR